MRATFVATLILIAAIQAVKMYGGDVCCDGDSWLKWSQTERQIYLQAYVSALMHGYTQGCNSANSALTATHNGQIADQVLRKCLDTTPVAGIDFTSYPGRITSFYAAGVKNRATPIYKVIDRLIAETKAQQKMPRSNAKSQN